MAVSIYSSLDTHNNLGIAPTVVSALYRKVQQKTIEVLHVKRLKVFVSRAPDALQLQGLC